MLQFTVEDDPEGGPVDDDGHDDNNHDSPALEEGLGDDFIDLINKEKQNGSKSMETDASLHLSLMDGETGLWALTMPPLLRVL